MKNFFGSVFSKLKDIWPSRRRIVQVFCALLYNANLKGFISGDIYQGVTKAVCVPGMNCYSCPGAIGACPLGSLQNALAGAKTKTIFYVVGILLLYGLIFGRTICGWLCPFGLIQDMLYKIRSFKIRKSKVTYALSYLKYVLLAVLVILIPLVYGYQNIAVPGFCKYICPVGTLEGAYGLLGNPNNLSLLDMLGILFSWKSLLLIFTIVMSILMFRPFCRFVCPLGAIYSFFNKINLFGITVDKQKCTKCGICVSHCDMDVHEVGDRECIQCGKCIPGCPVKAIHWRGNQVFLKSGYHPTPLVVSANNTNASSCETTIQNEVIHPTTMNEEIKPEENEIKAKPASNPVEERKIEEPKKSLKLNTILSRIVAPILMIGVLGTALVYYNFFDTKPTQQLSENEVNGNCSSFSITAFNHDEIDVTFDSDTPNEKNTLIVFMTEVDIFLLDSLEEQTRNNEILDTVIVYPYSCLTTVAQEILVNYSSSPMKIGHDDDEDSVVKALNPDGGYPSAVSVTKKGKILTMGDDIDDALSLALIDSELGNEVDDILPDYTLPQFFSETDWDVRDTVGKITFINFWGTWCGPCVAELPYFGKLRMEHDDINVIAVHSNYVTEDVVTFLENKSDADGNRWLDYGIQFVQDYEDTESESKSLYTALGGTSIYPMTFVLDTHNRIRFIHSGSVKYQTLLEEYNDLSALN